VRVLLTGMSGTGKSSIVRELRRRGFEAYDADDDGFAEPDEGGIWRWDAPRVSALLDRAGDGLLFFAGCSEEQVEFRWDLKVLLTAPEAVILERLADRSTNSYGKSAEERARVLADLREVEPLLRASADLVIETTEPLGRVVERVLAAAAPPPASTQLRARRPAPPGS
jgi:shikimate kinase